jgi:hypothetical protein
MQKNFLGIVCLSPNFGGMELDTIKLAKKLNRFKCPTSGCRYCQPYEAIVSGEAEYVGIGEFGQDLYLLDKTQNDDREGSIL